MPKTSDGELELVLGNKQLLSVFFVVVVLLGIFFAMGYIVGRNSAAGPAPPATQPSVVEREPAATPRLMVGEDDSRRGPRGQRRSQDVLCGLDLVEFEPGTECQRRHHRRSLWPSRA